MARRCGHLRRVASIRVFVEIRRPLLDIVEKAFLGCVELSRGRGTKWMTLVLHSPRAPELFTPGCGRHFEWFFQGARLGRCGLPIFVQSF